VFLVDIKIEFSLLDMMIYLLSSQSLKTMIMKSWIE